METIELIFRNKDGREFKIKDYEFSGRKLERWTNDGFTCVGVIGQSAEFLNQWNHRQLELFQKEINPKPSGITGICDECGYYRFLEHKPELNANLCNNCFDLPTD
jgi:hypothetical protein